MTNVVIGNIVGFLASMLMVYSGVIKKKNKIIYIQCIEKILSVISNIVLGGITGAVSSTIGFVRNVLCYRDRLRINIKILIILSMSILSLYFNSLGLIGALPVLATSIYTLFMDITDIVKFKILAISTTAMWVIYNGICTCNCRSFTNYCKYYSNI